MGFERCVAVAVLLWSPAALAQGLDYPGDDWGGADLVLADGDTLEGTFSNVGRFEVLAGAEVSVLSSGDVNADLLVGIYNTKTVAWYQNLGEGHVGSRIVISLSANGVYDVEAADLDGDGDLDVLAASELDDGKIAWSHPTSSVRSA